MFKQLLVPMRSFYCELKCRPPDDAYGGKLRTGEQEELIDVLILEVPKLKNSNIEKQWALAQPAVGIADIWNNCKSRSLQTRELTKYLYSRLNLENPEKQ